MNDLNVPKFPHDCSQCHFLGHHQGSDLYVCPQGSGAIPSVIARFGEEPEAYSSGLPTVTQALHVAAALAVEEGLLTYSDDPPLRYQVTEKLVPPSPVFCVDIETLQPLETYEEKWDRIAEQSAEIAKRALSTLEDLDIPRASQVPA